LVKKTILLTMALYLAFGTNFMFGVTYKAHRKARLSVGSSSHHRTKTHMKKVQYTPGRRRHRYNPWRLSSYADSTLGDNPAGEDPNVRAAAIDALGRWNGSIAVVDPNTGRILSIVNQKLATESAFTPCSTFKPITALAALKEGLITPETKIRSERKLRAYGSTDINLTQALAHSSNIFFSKVGQMLGFDRLAAYAHAFGLGEKTSTDIPGESAGRFPSEAPKEGGVGMLAYDGLTVDITALQMAAMVSAIANGGTLYELQYPRTAEDIEQFVPKVRRRLDDLVPYFSQVTEGMAASVLYGTGKSAYNPVEQIFGKTGTCSEDGARLGWFASYSGEQNHKYAVVVLLRGGRSMFGPHAAEIAGRFYQNMLQQDAVRVSQVLPLTSSPTSGQ
jgi:penicillin-binding protein 2